MSDEVANNWRELNKWKWRQNDQETDSLCSLIAAIVQSTGKEDICGQRIAGAVAVVGMNVVVFWSTVAWTP